MLASPPPIRPRCFRLYGGCGVVCPWMSTTLVMLVRVSVCCSSNDCQTLCVIGRVDGRVEQPETMRIDAEREQANGETMIVLRCVLCGFVTERKTHSHCS